MNLWLAIQIRERAPPPGYGEAADRRRQRAATATNGLWLSALHRAGIPARFIAAPPLTSFATAAHPIRCGAALVTSWQRSSGAALQRQRRSLHCFHSIPTRPTTTSSALRPTRSAAAQTSRDDGGGRGEKGDPDYASSRGRRRWSVATATIRRAAQPLRTLIRSCSFALIYSASDLAGEGVGGGDGGPGSQ
ncbi:hypothetical protein AAVH_18220 [Aphelenchoides avenae]|nr:hypothetical protein AAVH_18220 [Aphelenchus avenae]